MKITETEREILRLIRNLALSDAITLSKKNLNDCREARDAKDSEDAHCAYLRAIRLHALCQHHSCTRISAKRYRDLHAGLLKRAELCHIRFQSAGTAELLAMEHIDAGAQKKDEGDLDGAEAHYQKAKLLLGASDPSEAVATLWDRTGSVHFHRGRLDEAERCYKAALDLRQSLSEQNDGYISEREIAIGYHRLACICHRKGDHAGTVRYFRTVCEHMERLYERYGLPCAELDLVNALFYLGEETKGEESELLLARAREIFKSLLERHPESPILNRYKNKLLR